MSNELFLIYTEKEIEEYTAFRSAEEVLENLKQFVEIIQGHGQGAFCERYVNHIAVNKKCLTETFTDKDKFEANKPVFIDQSPEDWVIERNSFYTLAAAVYAFNAIEEYESNRTQHAWILANEAKLFFGLALGSDSAIVAPMILKSYQAKRNAYKSKERDRDAKKLVLDYYQTHIHTFESVPDAARKINALKPKLVDHVLSTIERWISEFHRNNPNIKRPTKSKR